MWRTEAHPQATHSPLPRYCTRTRGHRRRRGRHGSHRAELQPSLPLPTLQAPSCSAHTTTSASISLSFGAPFSDPDHHRSAPPPWPTGRAPWPPSFSYLWHPSAQIGCNTTITSPSPILGARSPKLGAAGDVPPPPSKPTAAATSSRCSWLGRHGLSPAASRCSPVAPSREEAPAHLPPVAQPPERRRRRHCPHGAARARGQQATSHLGPRRKRVQTCLIAAKPVGPSTAAVRHASPKPAALAISSVSPAPEEEGGRLSLSVCLMSGPG
jgi:hypothetical protein